MTIQGEVSFKPTANARQSHSRGFWELLEERFSSISTESELRFNY